MIAVQGDDKQIWIVQRDYELSSIGFLMRSEVKNSFKFVVRESFPCIGKNSRSSVIHDDKVCHIQMSSQPIAAYAFVSEGYPERVIFAFLNRVLQIFTDKVGNGWRDFKKDESLGISAISE